MTFGNKYGKKNVNWNVTTKGRDYLSLETLYQLSEPEEIHVMDCLYINDRSKYGAAPVAGVIRKTAKGFECCMVNLPKHKLDEVKEMLQDPEAVEAIRDGAAGFKIYQYTPKGSRQLCYSVEWCDVE